jgi:release factor glutamine methyltransferase
MNNSKSLFRDLITAIKLQESESEVRAIVTTLMESICRTTAASLMAGKSVNPEEELKLHHAVARVNRYEPLQYVLNEAIFFSRKFYVDPAVLIPRPETEELVELIIKRTSGVSTRQRIMDVATGSGCIAITLALELRNAKTWGTDVSDAALVVARRNAELLQSQTSLIAHNVLTTDLPVSDLDILVSNPPYIADSEKQLMDRNVLDYEPHLALFVPDSQPLIFYEVLARRGLMSLRPGGLLAVEINERFGRAVADVMSRAGLIGVEVLQDLAGKDRFVFARKAG